MPTEFDYQRECDDIDDIKTEYINKANNLYYVDGNGNTVADFTKEVEDDNRS